MVFYLSSQYPDNYSGHSKIKILNNQDEEFTLIEQYILKKASPGIPLNIIEAGCGRMWRLKLDGIKYTLTGIDIDKNALEIRKKKYNDLSEIIVGDLRYINLGKKYDVIYNSFVLEHIKDAERALNNFIKWLKPGGLLILRLPDRNSVYGFIVRNTPFFFRLLYNKYIRGFKDAGQPGSGPHYTYYDKIVSKEGIRDFCKKSELIIKEEVGMVFQYPEKLIFSCAIKAIQFIGYITSFGKLSTYNYLTYILEKNHSELKKK